MCSKIYQQCVYGAFIDEIDALHFNNRYTTAIKWSTWMVTFLQQQTIRVEIISHICSSFVAAWLLEIYVIMLAAYVTSDYDTTLKTPICHCHNCWLCCRCCCCCSRCRIRRSCYYSFKITVHESVNETKYMLCKSHGKYYRYVWYTKQIVM